MKINTRKSNKINTYIIMALAIMLMVFLFAKQVVYAEKIDANMDRVEDLKERAKVESQEEIADTLIRFHVLANSDADIDQDTKIQVRDRILTEIAPLLEKSQDLDETRKIIENKSQDMLDTAEEVLEENGFDYGASASFARHKFPTKYYGKFTLPAGEYETFQIILGEGKGSNWWCVMFPPLCFINVDEDGVEEDVGDIEEDTPQEEEKIEDLVQPAAKVEIQETEAVEETEAEEETLAIEEKQEPVEIRWKFVETLESVFNVFK